MNWGGVTRPILGSLFLHSNGRSRSLNAIVTDLVHLAGDGREPNVEDAEHRLDDEVGREGACG